MMLIFAHDGSPGFSGVWTSITAAKGFDASLLNVPQQATHFLHYGSGGTAALVVNEKLTGGSSSKTCRLVAQAVENGTAGSSDSGIIFVKNPSGTFQSETLTGDISTGTVAIVQDFIPILLPGGKPKTCLITVETASINFTIDGNNPTATSGTSMVHKMDAGQSYVIRGYYAITKFKCINAVASNGAIVKYTLFY